MLRGRMTDRYAHVWGKKNQRNKKWGKKEKKISMSVKMDMLFSIPTE